MSDSKLQALNRKKIYAFIEEEFQPLTRVQHEKLRGIIRGYVKEVTSVYLAQLQSMNNSLAQIKASSRPIFKNKVIHKKKT